MSCCHGYGNKLTTFCFTERADGSIVFNFGFSEAKEQPNEDPWGSNGSTRIHKDRGGIVEESAQESNMEKDKLKAEEFKMNGSSNNRDVILNSAAAMIPHPDKVCTYMKIQPCK